MPPFSEGDWIPKGVDFFDKMGAITQNFRYLKWRILKEPYFRLFLG